VVRRSMRGSVMRCDCGVQMEKRTSTYGTPYWRCPVRGCNRIAFRERYEAAERSLVIAIVAILAALLTAAILKWPWLS
jgi:hypothetical protein